MKSLRWTALAIGMVGCAQGQGSVPPPSTATPAPVAAATAAAAPTVAPTLAPAVRPTSLPETPQRPNDRPAPPRTRLIVPAGTLLPIELQTTVSSDSSQRGDSVMARLAEAVQLDGFTLDKGAEVRGRVTTVVAAKAVKGQARLVLVFDAIMEGGEKLSIETEPIDGGAKSSSSKDNKSTAKGDEIELRRGATLTLTVTR